MSDASREPPPPTCVCVCVCVCINSKAIHKVSGFRVLGLGISLGYRDAGEGVFDLEAHEHSLLCMHRI
jgi:hypothetical protein